MPEMRQGEQCVELRLLLPLAKEAVEAPDMEVALADRTIVRVRLVLSHIDNHTLCTLPHQLSLIRIEIRHRTHERVHDNCCHSDVIP